MNKLILFTGIVLLFSCKSENKNSENKLFEQKSVTQEIPQVNDQFQAFLDQFPKIKLPVKIKGCEDAVMDLPKLNEKLSLKYSSDAKSELIFGVFPSNGNYVSTITLGMAECMVPILTTYTITGQKIDSKAIFIGYCGADACYECIESMTIKTNYRIYAADTTRTYKCDENYIPIAGTESVEVIYKDGKIGTSGRIELTKEITKKIK
ncbi:hypothetical protein [Aquimarina sp. Aq78]|uniref:hypothetical protein n=1 Tax=Aquimarina sp. Aq78 TaxID=1191889 RepID=UPI000D106EBE|nr:hypothetical protein [Aquimarina sp. Aq78]